MTRPLEEVLAVPEGVTEGPWEETTYGRILGSPKSLYVCTDDRMDSADRAHIVRCVNLYPLLVAVAVACEALVDCGAIDLKRDQGHGPELFSALSALRSAAEGKE